MLDENVAHAATRALARSRRAQRIPCSDAAAAGPPAGDVFLDVLRKHRHVADAALEDVRAVLLRVGGVGPAYGPGSDQQGQSALA